MGKRGWSEPKALSETPTINTMSPKIQRAATGWLLPVTLVLLSPLIIRSAWSAWRRKEKTKRSAEYQSVYKSDFAQTKTR